MSLPRPNILIIRRRYLGDVVLLGCVLRNLRLHWPEARLILLVEHAYAALVTLHPDADAALVLPRRFREWPGLLHRLRRARFTHVIDLDNTEKTAAISRLTGAPFRLALHYNRIKLRHAYTRVVLKPEDPRAPRPMTEHYLLALREAGVPIRTREFRLVPRPVDLASMRRVVGSHRRILLVHPGSRSSCRIWPLERFAAVCDRVQRELDTRVVLVGGPGEETLVAEIRRQAHTPLHMLAAPPTLPQLAALARLSHAVLCHDSGPMHVAATVGTPVVALHGSQDPAPFRPVGPGHAILQPPLPCVACVAPDRCVRSDSYRTYCVQQLTVDEVFAAVASTLRLASRESGHAPAWRNPAPEAPVNQPAELQPVAVT